jgi:hypothetical protein
VRYVCITRFVLDVLSTHSRVEQRLAQYIDPVVSIAYVGFLGFEYTELGGRLDIGKTQRTDTFIRSPITSRSML